MSIPRPVLDLATRQHNVIARRQVMDLMTDDEYQGHLRRGRLTSLHRGVSAVAGGAAPPQQRLMAAALRAGPGARVTGPAVLGLFDIDGFGPRDPFTVLLPAGRRVGRVPFRVARDPLPGVDTATFDHVPIARLPLALLDAAACRETATSDRRLRVGLDSACGKGLSTRDAILDRALELGEGHAGAAWLLDLECGGGLRAESERERQVAAILRDVHPRPEVQAWLAPRIRPDFLWRSLRVVGEYLGWVDHAPDDDHDHHRFTAIRALGHELVLITAADLRDPEALVARVQTTLVRRARHLGIPLA